MPRFPRFALSSNAFVAVAIASSAAVNLAGDWPQWRGPHRDGHADVDRTTAVKLDPAPAVAWKVPVGFGLDSPVVAAGVVYYLDNNDGKETVHAADAKTGKPLWADELDQTFKDAQSQPGPRCTAAVDGDRVYAQSCRGKLKCLSTADGKERWGVDYAEAFGAVFIGEKGSAEGSVRHGFAGSPLVEGDRVVVGVAGKEFAYACFDKATGKVLWQTHLEKLNPAYAAPVVATLAGVRQVVAFTTGAVVGLDLADGKLLWRSPVKTSLGRHATTPVVVGNTVVVGSFQAGLVGVRVGRDGDGLKAEQAWATKEAMPNFSSPVLVGGTHVVGVGQGLKMFCVEAATGKVAWSTDASLGKEHAGLIVVGQTVLALGDGGDLVAFAADPTGYKELGRAKVCDKNWCTPAYADGKLYLRDNRELRCLELAK